MHARSLIFKKFFMSEPNASMPKSRSQNFKKMLLVEIYYEIESKMREAFCKYLYILLRIYPYL